MPLPFKQSFLSVLMRSCVHGQKKEYLNPLVAVLAATFYCHDKQLRRDSFSLSDPGGGGKVLPYMKYIAMYNLKGFGFERF